MPSLPFHSRFDGMGQHLPDAPELAERHYIVSTVAFLPPPEYNKIIT